MAFKPRGNTKSASELLPVLNNSKIQQTNPALYQTIAGLINNSATYAEVNDATVANLISAVKQLQSVVADTVIHPFLLMGS